MKPKEDVITPEELDFHIDRRRGILYSGFPRL